MPSGIYKRKPFTKEHRKNIGKVVKGRIYTQEAIKKRIETRRKKYGWFKNPEEQHKKASISISKANKGNPKIINAQKRKWENPEYRENQIKKRTGKKASEETTKLMSDSHKGNKNPNWQDGKSFELYGVEFNNKKRNKIKKRDNFTCQLCGDKILEKRRIKINPTKNWLTVHHIDYNKKNSEDDNLVTLCNLCNISVNTKREEWTKYFQNKVGKFQNDE